MPSVSPSNIIRTRFMVLPVIPGIRMGPILKKGQPLSQCCSYKFPETYIEVRQHSVKGKAGLVLFKPLPGCFLSLSFGCCIDHKTQRAFWYVPRICQLDRIIVPLS